MFYIVQVSNLDFRKSKSFRFCPITKKSICVKCDRFEGFSICPELNYKKFIIENFNMYEYYCYYIFDSSGFCVEFVHFD